MQNGMALTLSAVLLLAATITEARPGDRLRELLAEHRGAQQVAYPGRVADETAIADPAQRVFICPTTTRPRASATARTLPPLEEQARDIGRALARLCSEAADFGYDPDHILLLGHSAGAHLAALVSTDAQHAQGSFAAIQGTLLIDGACHDVPAQVASSPFMARRTCIRAFGTDPKRQRALSLITYTVGCDVPDWLLLYRSARDDARAQSQAPVRALQHNSALTELVEVPAETTSRCQAHLEINHQFGIPGYAANRQIEVIMHRVEAESGK